MKFVVRVKAFVFRSRTTATEVCFHFPSSFTQIRYPSQIRLKNIVFSTRIPKYSDNFWALQKELNKNGASSTVRSVTGLSPSYTR